MSNDLLITTLLIVALFVLLGSGVWIGLALAGVAWIGKVTLPELKGRGYPDDITIGTLAGAGTLGLLIPPSIIMIVYGVSANVSISQLFIAGVIPGLILASLFSGYIVVWALFHPGRIPDISERTAIAQKLFASRHLIPVVVLIGLVLGSIYAGIATEIGRASCRERGWRCGG